MLTRFMLIGLDGADPDLVERWMAAGTLPNLARLRARGSFLPCASTTPPATFPAWTTCVTGVNPGRHGIVDFTQTVPGSYAIRFVNARDRQAPALWDVLSAAGRRVGVLGVPATYPPDPVNGFMVSGFDSPVCTGVDPSFVHPPSLYPEVEGWRFADFQESRIGPGWHDMALRRLLDRIDAKEAIALRMLRREPWDFFMAVFGETDTVSHHFWMFHDSRSPRHRPGPHQAIRHVYERLDATVGRLIDAAGPDTLVGVVSDHGFGGAGTGVVHLNNRLAQRSFLRFTHDGGSPLKALVLRTVPPAWRGALFRRFHRLATRAEGRSRFAGIDWSGTLAWSEELNYFPSVRVNLAGREPEGQVDPADYDAFCATLCRDLEAWGPVRKAWRRDEIYAGPFMDRAPDIVLELALEDGYSHSCLRSRGGPPFRRLAPQEFPGGKERGMNGNHRPTGIFLLSVPVDATEARLQDVAPTVLALLNVAGPPMDGRSLVGGGAEPAPWAGEPPALRYTPEQERAIEKRLRGLGYFE